MGVKLTAVLSKLDFSCLCRLIENEEGKKLEVRVGCCTELEVPLCGSTAKQCVWRCLYKQTAVSISFF